MNRQILMVIVSLFFFGYSIIAVGGSVGKPCSKDKPELITTLFR